MRILFVCRNLDRMAGGVERMATLLMHAMLERGHRVALLSWDCGSPEPFYPLDKRIEWFRLDLGDPRERAGTWLRLRRLLRIRSMVRALRPEVAIAYQAGAFQTVRLATAGCGLPMIAAERNSPSRFRFTSEGRRARRILHSLRLADAVTVQFDEYRSLYPDALQEKLVAIPNPVVVPPETARPAGDTTAERRLLSVGRLSYQKNYPALIGAFNRLAAEYPRWTLTILGEGEERPRLEEMIARSPHGKRIALPGATGEVKPALLGAHLFCLPSRWEGFPNALAEAMAHGLPAVGFAECDGVRHLIQDGQTGRLAPGSEDAAALAGVLAALMRDDAERAALGTRARESMRAYAPAGIFERWERLFASLSRDAGRR